MSQSAHFKWFNGDATRRLEIAYENGDKLFENLIAKMTQCGFQHGKESVFWIDTDGDYILLEDAESMEIALKMHPNDGVIMLESGAVEDVIFTGEGKAMGRGRGQMASRGRRPGPPPDPRMTHDFLPHFRFLPMYGRPPFHGCHPWAIRSQMCGFPPCRPPPPEFFGGAM